MAWPCITRACCINRFWTELDKADISVPLVFTKYSDVADVQHVQHHPQPRIKRPGPGPGSRPGPGPGETREPEQAAAGKPPPKDGSAASVMRQDFKAWRVRPEPSCKPRNEFQRSAAPFNNETQYQKDYKPWPIPKKHDHPWIPKASPTAGGGGGGGGGGGDGGAKMEPPETGVEKSEIEEKVQEKESKEPVKEVKESKEPVKEPKEPKEKEVQLEEVQPPAGESSSEQKKGRAAADALNRHIKQNMTTASSYRTEFKAYKDVKPVKAIKAASQYQPPAAETTSRETSYSATYKGEQVKAASDNKMLERRRIRSLYNEPAGKDAAVAKADKPASRSKPKKTTVTTTTAGKTAKKSKEKQPAAKKKATTPEPKPDGGVTKKSKEISNRLAEAKQ